MENSSFAYVLTIYSLGISLSAHAFYLFHPNDLTFAPVTNNVHHLTTYLHRNGAAPETVPGVFNVETRESLSRLRNELLSCIRARVKSCMKHMPVGSHAPGNDVIMY